MDFRRAQRNLNLLLIDGNPDTLAFSENDNPDRFNSSPIKSFNDTQVPDFDLSSSDIDVRHPTNAFSQEILENKGISQNVRMGDNMATGADGGNGSNNDGSVAKILTESTNNKKSQSDQIDNDDGTSTSNNNNYSNQIFLNTQIQSRLDEANKVMEMKSQLNQFKYTQEESQPISSSLVLKRLNSNTNSQSKPNKNMRKTSSQPSRSSYLMELLSGKNKKVKDIFKNHNQKTKDKLKDSTKKNKKIIYDTYNEQEWTILKQLLLEKFPQNTNEDVNEIFRYIYGDSESQIKENMEQNSVDMWSASQQSLYVSPKISQNSHFSTQENKDEKFKLLSLSQIMEDTSMTNINQVNDRDNNFFEGSNNEKSIYINNRILEENVATNYEENPHLVIDSDDSKDNIDYKSNLIELDKENIEKFSEVEKNTKAETYNNGKIGYNSTNEFINNKDYALIYDSMEEEEQILNRIHIENEDKFKKQKIYDLSHNVPEISKFKPTLNLGFIPLLPFDPISPEKKNSMINLTQGSFKVTSELVSPIKSIPSELNSTKELLIGNQVQIPATRTTTFDGIQEIEEVECNEYSPDVMLKIHKEQLNNLIETQDYFKIQNAIRVNERDNIVYDSYDDEEHSGNTTDMLENEIIVTLAPRTEKKKTSTLIISPIKSSLKEQETDSLENHKDIESELWESQSIKDIRLNIRQTGLKTSRKKAEMIESLRLASQILQSQGVSEVKLRSQTSKDDIFKYLSLLAKQFPLAILEKFYTFQAVPINEVIEKFNLIDPFVDRIEEQTIKEWAELNGIILCQ